MTHYALYCPHCHEQQPGISSDHPVLEYICCCKCRRSSQWGDYLTAPSSQAARYAQVMNASFKPFMAAAKILGWTRSFTLGAWGRLRTEDPLRARDSNDLPRFGKQVEQVMRQPGRLPVDEEF